MNMPNTRAVALMLSAGYGADALRHYEFYVLECVRRPERQETP